MKLKSILLLSIIWTLQSCTQTTTPKEGTSKVQPIKQLQPTQVEKEKQTEEKQVAKKPVERIESSKAATKTIRRASDYLKEDIYIAVMRAYIKPDQTSFSKSLGSIEYGETCTFLNQTSEQEETIELRGEMKTDYWKKVIKSIPSPSGQGPDTEIEGWIFGGQLMKASEIYRNTSPDHYERKIINAGAKQLTKILGFKVHLQGYYNGTVNYRINKNDQWQKNGKFEVHCFNQVEDSDQMITQRHEFLGNYSSDVHHGLFEKISVGHLSNRHSKVFYENGKCLWAESTETEEGKDHVYREELPKQCGFEYIDKEMFKKEFNMKF